MLLVVMWLSSDQPCLSFHRQDRRHKRSSTKKTEKRVSRDAAQTCRKGHVPRCLGFKMTLTRSGRQRELLTAPQPSSNFEAIINPGSTGIQTSRQTVKLMPMVYERHGPVYQSVNACSAKPRYPWSAVAEPRLRCCHPG